jgi:hypothetical protein
MRSLYRVVFSVVFAAVVLSPLCYAQRDRDDRDRRYEERGPYARARGLVGRVLRDLERAQRMAPVAGKQRERYENAQRHLSQFDERLSRGDFDKDKLDEAIADVHNVVKNNVLSPRSRDQLRDDVEDLRSMRANRGRF